MKYISSLIFIFTISGLIGQNKLTNVGFATGSHGWGITAEKLYRYNDNIFWGIDGRLYFITGIGDTPTTNYYGYQQNRNQKSLFMIPISLGVQYFPLHGKIANNFYPFIQTKAGPLVIFDGDESINSFFERWQKAETQITYGLQFGLGVKFIVPPYSFMSIMFGYDIFPLLKVTDGKENYNGGVLQLNFSININD